jgi:hypothetical protein
MTKRWSRSDVATLKSLAHKHSLARIAAKLGRSPGAVGVKASELKLSLSFKNHKVRILAPPV